MADLDDFFAKKDKKKSKGKKVAGTSTAPGSGSEVDASAAPQPAKKAEKKKEGDGEAGKKAGEEDEWADFQEEREKDYSGLKIQKLQIQEAEDSGNQASSEHELNEEGEIVKREPAGPWNKAGQPAAPAVSAPVREPEVVASLPNTTGGVYVPPSRRGQQTTESASSRSKTGRKNVVPDLNRDELFPTLSAAIAIDQAAPKTKKQLEQSTIGFTEAKPSRSHSSRGAAAGGEDGPRLNLGNKFDALSDS